MVKTRSKTKNKEQTTPSTARASLPPKSPARASLPPKSPARARLPPKSPARQQVDTEEQESVGSNTSNGSDRGIAGHILKQLAKDIEAAGGIKLFTKEGKNLDQALCFLCDHRQETYGKRGQPLRSQITKKVYRWQILDKEGRYDSKVLNFYQVKSFANLQADLKGSSSKRRQDSPAKKQASRPNSVDSLHSFSSSDSSSSSSIGSTTAAPSSRSQFTELPFSPPTVIETERTNRRQAPVAVAPPPVIMSAHPRSPMSSALPRGAG
jgi:hypothetical protein